MRTIAVLLLAWSGSGVGAADGRLLPVSRNQLCVTSGSVATAAGGALLVDSPEMRAVVASAPARTVEARFRYLGPTKDVKRLASGERRRQFGLKLRAANTCNLVYVMWHIEPDARLAVSVKSNPGLTTHAQCDARGYRNLRPARQSPVPVLRRGQWHRLTASLAGEQLDVSLDGSVVWQGGIGGEGMAFDGPVGMRSDNGRFEVKLFQSAPEGEFAPAVPCRGEPGESE